MKNIYARNISQVKFQLIGIAKIFKGEICFR